MARWSHPHGLIEGTAALGGVRAHKEGLRTYGRIISACANARQRPRSSHGNSSKILTRVSTDSSPTAV